MRHLHLHCAADQGARLAGVVDIVGERIGDRVRHHDRAGEMDDGVNGIAEQDGSNKVMVADVPFHEFRLVGDG